MTTNRVVEILNLLLADLEATQARWNRDDCLVALALGLVCGALLVLALASYATGFWFGLGALPFLAWRTFRLVDDIFPPERS